MDLLPYVSQGAVRVLRMRRYLALAALSSTALLSGCAAASADAGAVVDTKTPAPVAAAATSDAGVIYCHDGITEAVLAPGYGADSEEYADEWSTHDDPHRRCRQECRP